MGVFPFGRPATERPPRRPPGRDARLFVLGVYPSALHVRWCRPDGVQLVKALAVDDEPEVFWDGKDADERVRRWAADVGWQRGWGTVTASGNGTSGRAVVDDVLRPLGVEPDEVYFTDAYRRFLVKSGGGSQRAAMDSVYGTFAAARGLPAVSLPSRPTDPALVRMALDEDRGALRTQLSESGAGTIVTLGQPAADVFAARTGSGRVVLRRDRSYGAERVVPVGRGVVWLPLKHPGQRSPVWQEHHARWVDARSS